METRENKNAKIANLRNPRKFKPAKIRAHTVVSCEGNYQNKNRQCLIWAHFAKFSSRQPFWLYSISYLMDEYA